MYRQPLPHPTPKCTKDTKKTDFLEPSPYPKYFEGAQIYFKDPTPGDVKGSGYHGERPAKNGRGLFVVQVVELHRLRIGKVKVICHCYKTYPSDAT